MRNTLSKAGGKKKKVGHLFSGSPTDGNTGLKPSVSTKVERGQRVSFMLNPNHLKWIHQTATRSGINSSQLLDQVIEFSRNYSQNLEQGFQSGAAWTSEKFAIQISFERIAAFCRRQSIQRLSLFGSVLTDKFGNESDIDVLIEFFPDVSVGFLKLSQIEIELKDIFGERKVDLKTLGELSSYFREKIFQERKIIYAV